MLIKILKSLAKGGIYSNKVMATELGIDESLVEQMIDKLLQMGYIEKENISSCNNGCSCCSNKGCCGSSMHNINFNLWRVTVKGKRAISN